MKTHNNAFEILTDNPEELQDYQIRSGMIDQLVNTFKEKKWTTEQAANALMVSPLRIENILNGRISRLPKDTLAEMLTNLGIEYKDH